MDTITHREGANKGNLAEFVLDAMHACQSGQLCATSVCLRESCQTTDTPTKMLKVNNNVEADEKHNIVLLTPENEPSNR